MDELGNGRFTEPKQASKRQPRGGDRQETSVTITQMMHRTSAHVASVKDRHSHHDHHTSTHPSPCPKSKTKFIFMLTEGRGPGQSGMTQKLNAVFPKPYNNKLGHFSN